MITFKQYLHALGQLPNKLKVDVNEMTDRQRLQYEAVRQQHLKEQMRKQQETATGN